MFDLNNTNCNKCKLCKLRRSVVNGFGNSKAKIVLIGEGPGFEEDRQGFPFVGPSGKQLTKMLMEAGIDRESVFITNVVRCIPKTSGPENVRAPEPDEVDACFEYLEKEMASIKPNVIVPMGNAALRAIMQKGVLNITKRRGLEVWNDKFNCKVIPTFHPAAILRQPRYEGITISDLKRIKESSEYPELTKQNVGNYVIVETSELLESALNRINELQEFTFDIESTGFNWRNDKILCISFSWKEGTGITIPLIRYNGKEEEYTEMKVKKVRRKDKETKEWVYTEQELPTKQKRIVDEYFPYWGEKQNDVIESLRKIFANDAYKCAHNGKFDMKFLIFQFGFEINNYYFDTMLAHYLLDENIEHGLKGLATTETDMGGYEEEIDNWFKERRVAEKNRNYACLPPKMLYEYCAKDTDCCFRLLKKFKQRLEADPDLNSFFFRLIMPLNKTLMQAELDGTAIDTDYIQKLKTELLLEQKGLLNELLNEFGTTITLTKVKQGQLTKVIEEFNIRSHDHLRELLFNQLHLKSFKQTKGKDPKPSTDEEVLIELSKVHHIPKKILEYRKLDKLLGTYIKGIEEALDPNDRIHTTFLIHGTVTGRLASREPNLQNIPRDDKRIKKSFISRPGWILIEADYGQAEFRHWANYSQDEQMLKDIRSGVDIHKLTASNVLSIPITEVTKQQRQQAKNVVFGLMYGRGTKSLAEEFGLTEDEAKRIIKVFFGRYPRAEAWLREAIKTAKIYGQVRNVFGRLRRLPGINSLEFGIQAEAERQAVNSPIQSAASDMNCNSANRIKMRFEKENLSGILCLLIHDSLIYEIPENELEKSLNIIKEEMERPTEVVNVPMIAEFKVGTRWGMLSSFEFENKIWYKINENDKQKVTFEQIRELVHV